MKILSLILTVNFILSISCTDKHVENPCKDKIQPVAEFAIKEIVGDTAFIADTVFRDNAVRFEALNQYATVKWKIGDDPRNFSEPKFQLYFLNDLLTIPITFTGTNTPDKFCFPNDNGIYSGIKQLTTVEQYDKAILALSPLIGRYKGYFTSNPLDTFTVRIEYFDSLKYDPSITGNKNFYWISNIPKGYKDLTSSPALEYPELSNGLPIEMGYKCFEFGWSASKCDSGNGWLSHDTLYVNYGLTQCKKKFVGKRI